jgi:hypothetical protein
MTARPNPFFFGRLEFEKSPTLFVPDKLLDWASGKPIRFEGQRGSGKSSILKALTWDVAWKVSSLKITGSESVLRFLERAQHVGIYAKVEEMDVPYWDKWGVPEDVRQRYFGTYLEFLYLDLVLDALDGIRKKACGILSDPKAERDLVASLLLECFSDSCRPKLFDKTITSLRELVADVHRSIRQLVFQKVPEQVILATHQVVGPGSLVRTFAAAFRRSYPHLSSWLFLILLDDCNFLKEWQAKVVNTAVAQCKDAVAYKLSSLTGMYPTLDTLIEDRPIMAHDCETVQLPCKSPYTPDGARSEREYVRFLNGVCKARIEEHYGKQHSDRFDLKRFLGHFDVESLLKDKLKASEADEARRILEIAEETGRGRVRPPITRAWLSFKAVRKEAATIMDGTEDRRKLRQQSSRYHRKWAHVAAVALCREFGFEFPYSGYRVVLHLTGDSVRELLRIMSMIWEESQCDIAGFVTANPISIAVQTRGIVQAAEARFEVISDKPHSEAGATLKGVCRRLGELFKKCQSYPYILATPETASVSVRSDAIHPAVSDVLRKAIFTGTFLVRDDGNRKMIGLHPILAPKFQISFRDPFYYPEPIAPDQLQTLFLGSDAQAREVERMVLGARSERYQERHTMSEPKLQGTDTRQDTLFDIEE